MNNVWLDNLSSEQQIVVSNATTDRTDALDAMNDAQVDYGTQSPQFAQASAAYEQATHNYNQVLNDNTLPL